MAEKTILGPDFGPNFGHEGFFFMSFTSIRCYTLLQAIIICNFKEN